MSVPSSGEAEQKQPLSLGYLFGIIGTLSALLIAITNARGFLDPLTFNAVIVILALAIGIVVAYGFVVSPLLFKIKRRFRETRQESVASDILPHLADLIDKFAEIASTRYTTGIHSAIQSFQMPGVPAPEIALQVSLLQKLSGHFHKLVDEPLNRLQSDIRLVAKTRRKKLLLAHFAEEFYDLVWIYKSLFVNSYVEACSRVGVDSVPHRSREEYAKFTVKYSQFVSSYKEFANRLNKQIGERLVGEYLEDALPLKV